MEPLDWIKTLLEANPEIDKYREFINQMKLSDDAVRASMYADMTGGPITHVSLITPHPASQVRHNYENVYPRFMHSEIELTRMWGSDNKGAGFPEWQYSDER